MVDGSFRLQLGTQLESSTYTRARTHSLVRIRTPRYYPFFYLILHLSLDRVHLLYAREQIDAVHDWAESGLG